MLLKLELLKGLKAVNSKNSPGDASVNVIERLGEAVIWVALW
jgi:hypothetical protein